MHSYDHGPLTFPVVDSGPQDAPGERTVVLLHGFPETSAAWAGVTPHLTAAGLRTLAPDTRGTAPQARPATRGGYRLDHVVGDVLALFDAAGVEKAHLVGHDWGGGIAWEVARRHPERLASLTVLSTPHPAAMAWASLRSAQVLKSSYMGVMQVPFLPERLGAAAVRRGALARLGLSAEQTAAYTERFSDPAALSGAIGLYRGLVLSAVNGRGVPDRIDVPTTYVWGNRDAYLGRAAAERTATYCHRDYRFVELDADHWLPEKNTDVVVREVLARVTGV